MKYYLFTVSLLLITGFGGLCQYKSSLAAGEWVDSVYRSLGKKERIAQLIILRAHSNKGQGHIDSVTADIKKYKVGGLCFFQGGPVRQAMLTNLYQSVAKTPLLITIDGEWGLGMRLDSVINYPRPMMLGALQDPSIVYAAGKAIGEQCRRMGIHINYAPVVDINNNPANPVINDRSFGEDKFKVAKFGVAFMKGMQDAGIIACAKHFPGHGDVEVDSHHDLPVINKTKAQLDSLELYPFKEMIKAGILSIMVGHLFVPSIDSTPNRPTSLSYNAVHGLLRNDMGFKGLSVTDGLEMKGVTKYFPSGEASAEALIAGNDILCLPEDVKGSIKAIKKALRKNKIEKQEFEAKVKKVLLAKYNAGLYATAYIDTVHLINDLNEKTNRIKTEIAANALTLLGLCDKDMLPLRTKQYPQDEIFRNVNTNVADKATTTLQGSGNPSTLAAANTTITPNTKSSIAYLGVGVDKANTFATQLQKRFGTAIFTFSKKDSSAKADSLIKLLSQYDKIIIGVHGYSRRPANRFGISAAAYQLINTLQANKKTISFVFGNPYAIKNIAHTSNNLIACYEDDEITQNMAADLLTGNIEAKGTLPVTVSAQYAYGSGILTNEVLPYDVPESVGMNSEVLNKIDSIANDAIAQRATPGCVVLVAKDGKVVFDKSYGYTFSDRQQLVKNDMIYDLASVTKVAATTIAVMKLYEQGRLDINKTLTDYLPWVKGSNKENLLISNLLLHEAGLKAWIPFSIKTLDKEGQPLPTLYSNVQNELFNVKVSQGVYLRKDYVDTMYRIILDSKLGPPQTYEYSDNDFIFLGKIVESITGQALQDYVRDSFYIPMQMNSTRFTPRQYFSAEKIVPTAQEINFRKQLLQGDVHDPAAAMFGGVAGHAGLFSNAYDLAKLFQMLLNGGELSGVRYLQKSTIDKFTSYNSTVSRRGLGFDKPEKDNETNPSPYPATYTSPLTFGHTGFTGTCVWADPAYNLVYVFLSNRVAYEKTEGNKLQRMKVRASIMDVIYRSIGVQ